MLGRLFCDLIHGSGLCAPASKYVRAFYNLLSDSLQRMLLGAEGAVSPIVTYESGAERCSWGVACPVSSVAPGWCGISLGQARDRA